MAARVALALSAALLCLVLGWVSARPAPAAVMPARTLRMAALRLDAAGPAAAADAAALAGVSTPDSTDAAPPAVRRSFAPTAAPAPPPPPAPPAADAVLRSSVAAVTDDHGALAVVLAGGGGRTLRAGDRFLGWTVASVSRSDAVLSRGAERRRVAFFAPASPADPALAAPQLGPSAALPAHLPPPRPVAPEPQSPTAAEFFRGFKG